jgi:hypothetical protein
MSPPIYSGGGSWKSESDPNGDGPRLACCSRASTGIELMEHGNYGI